MEAHTDYGRFIVAERQTLFALAIDLTGEHKQRCAGRTFSWAFTGGSTPQEWYRWCVDSRALPPAFHEGTLFTVSDERHVPLESEQSNFGVAERLLLNPLKVPADSRKPWPVDLPPEQAARLYAEQWASLAGRGRGYDVCFLGMGDDGHTASLFPGSPLIADDGGELFTSVEVPGKGWRLTVTPSGLNGCGLIVVMALGAAKAKMIARVLEGPHDPQQTPIQLLRTWRSRVVWLVDEAAAAQL